MPAFDKAAHIVSSVYHGVVNVMLLPVTTACQAVTMLQQSRAKTKSLKTTTQEESKALQISSQLKQLTPQEVQGYINSSQLSEMLDSTVNHSAIVLQSHHDAFVAAEQKVHEYLAATTLLSAEDPQHVSIMSKLLYDTLGTIIDISATKADRSRTNRRILLSASKLIEHVIFNRCPAIRGAIERRLKPYVDINEMLQLLCILQDMLVYNNTAHVYDMSYTNDISEVLSAYEYNDALLHSNYMLGRQVPLTYNTMRRDALVATQVFAAIAARRGLYYDMHRNFNDADIAYVHRTERYARSTFLPHSKQKASPTRLAHQFTQLRMSHAMSTYYMFHILEEFVHTVLDTRKTKLFTEDKTLHYRQCAVMYLLNSQILEEVVTAMSVRFTEYIYASAIIYVNENNGVSKAQIYQLLQEMHAAQKERIIDDAIHHIFNTFAPSCIATKKEELSKNPHKRNKNIILIASNIFYDLSPTGGDYGIQIIRYLKLCGMQLLNDLPDELFYKLLICASPEKAHAHRYQDILLPLSAAQMHMSRTKGYKVDKRQRRHECVMHTILLIHAALEEQRFHNLYDIMLYVKQTLYTSMKHMHTVSVLRTTAFSSNEYRSHDMCILTRILMSHIQTNCVDNTISCFCNSIVLYIVFYMLSYDNYNPLHLLGRVFDAIMMIL